jgi:AraC-like DNA-binding protein
MGEKAILIVSSIAAFSYTMLSILCFMKAGRNRIFLWLGLLFFSPLLAFISNLLVYFHQGSEWMFHISTFFNLSFGGYLVLIMKNLGKRHQNKINPFLFLPSLLYVPFIIFSFFNPEPIEEIVSYRTHGFSLAISSVYNYLIIAYSLTVNVILLLKEIRLVKPKQESRLKIELLTIMLALQLFAFIPYLLKMDIIYIILYMPVFGQLFFIYLFFRLTTRRSASMLSLVKEKYAGLQVEEDVISDMEKQIVQLMNEKQFFLAEDSSLKAMAQALDETPNRVSMIINSRFNQSYSDFINSYRIKLAIERLTSDNNKLSMEGLAFECGFGNRSSFYQAFKKETGKTPSAYTKQ